MIKAIHQEKYNGWTIESDELNNNEIQLLEEQLVEMTKYNYSDEYNEPLGSIVPEEYVRFINHIMNIPQERIKVEVDKISS